MQWYNEPPEWAEESGIIHVHTAPKTDFWRKTHYGFIRDNGHFYHQDVNGDFVAEVKFSGQYRDLYDQAGLMIRQDENTWIKCGVEFVHNTQQASAVITREYSDWSVTPLHQNPSEFWLRVDAHLPAVEVYYSLDGENYTLLRLGYLTTSQPLKVGLMCCSPDGEGFDVRFENFIIKSSNP